MADEIFETSFQLDTSAIESRWETIQTWKYSLLIFNCTHAVIRVLSAGNAAFDTDFSDAIGRPKMGTLFMSFLDKELGQIRELKRKIEWFKTNGIFTSITSFGKRN